MDESSIIVHALLDPLLFCLFQNLRFPVSKVVLYFFRFMNKNSSENYRYLCKGKYHLSEQKKELCINKREKIPRKENNDNGIF